MGIIDDKYMMSEDSEIETALHIAHKSNSTQCVEVILKYLSFVHMKNSINYIGILDQLIEYKYFDEFFNNLLFQTNPMVSKNML